MPRASTRRRPTSVELAIYAALGLLAAMLGACGSPDPETSTSTTGSATSEETSADSSGGPPPSGCAVDPPCDMESLCQVANCGGKGSAFDAAGCARTQCESDASCPGGERCYPLAMGAVCQASIVDCEPSDQGCLCGSTNDCNGVFGAHCLPESTFPVDGYCDLDTFTCPDLAAWHDTLRSTRSFHDDAGHTELTERLAACSVSVVEARLACGETACAVACQFSSCPGSDTATCTAACEASDLDPGTIEATASELAVLPDPVCVCDQCEGEATCESAWGC